MKPVIFDKKCYRIDGQPVYPYSGEFHYFRVPKQDWRRRMELFKEAGGNCIATYIPWLIHEPVEGQVIFGGEDGMLDLEGFLQTAAEVGLYVVARPGPYQYSELKYDGLPTWLCDNYPQIRATTIDGKDFRNSSVSYVHPLFLEKVNTWYGHVCPIIARYSVNNGGPVAFTQIDNEMGGIHWWVAGHDYNAEAMGFGKADGYYTRFLRRRYGTIEELNRLYEANYARFEDVRPILPGTSDKLAEIRQARDYFDFYEWTTGEYARRLAEMARSYGIDTPLIHNSPNPASNAQFLEVVEMVPPPFLLGSDHYYNLGQAWSQNNPTPQYAINVFLSNEMLRLMGFPPTVFELPGGSCSDWPPVTPQDAKACYLANIALGMKSSNLYIFTGGPNPPGAGITSDIYDFGAPIGADGEVRPLYDAVKETGLFLQEHPELVEMERVADCRVALDFEYPRAEKYWKSSAGFQMTASEAWDFLKKGPMITAFCVSLSPVFIDLRTDDWVADTSTPLIVVSSSSMAAEKQQRIVDFMMQGGRVLVTPVMPIVDEKLEPCTILADYLGNPTLEKNTNQLVRLTIGGVVNILNSGDVYVTTGLPTGAEVLGTDELTGRTVAWKIAPAGGGAAIVLGFRWLHAMREHERMLLSLLNTLGVQQRVLCSNPNVWTSLRSDGRGSFLFLLNLLSSPMTARVSCLLPDRTMIDTGEHNMEAMSVKVIAL